MQQLSLFKRHLPHKPYCSDDLAYGLIIRGKTSALSRSHIQYNPPATVAWLIFDVDREDASLAWEDANLPPPAWVAVNPKNGHAHIAYGIIDPVCRTELARHAPLRYLMAIEQAYQRKMGADRGFASLITKNPLNPAWRVWYPIIDGGIYTLDELADYVELEKIDRRKNIDPYGLGRNCIAFDQLRTWAYSAVRDYWRPGGELEFGAAAEARAIELNIFDSPLPYSEIRATAKSVSRWTWRHFTPSKWRETQSNRGKRSGEVRAAKSKQLALQAHRMREQGMRQREIADKLCLSPGRISQMLKKFN